jgi:hypothetical protein
MDCLASAGDSSGKLALAERSAAEPASPRVLDHPDVAEARFREQRLTLSHVDEGYAAVIRMPGKAGVQCRRSGRDRGSSMMRGGGGAEGLAE